MGVKIEDIICFCAIFIMAIGPIFAQGFVEVDEEIPKNATSKRSRICISRNGIIGQCIPFDYCNSLQEIVEQNPEIGEQIMYNYRCPGGRRTIIVCCPLLVGNNPIRPDPRPVVTSESNTNKVQPLRPPQCGRSFANHDRVVGGNPAELGAWPWIGLLGYGSASSAKVAFKCGGTLVSSRTVVTAAHCVYGQNSLRVVRLGEHDLARNDWSNSPVDYLIRKKIVHPKYNPDTAENDIALLIIDEVSFTDLIRPICLPITDELKNRDFVRNFPFVAGWGATRFEGSSSSVLREVQIPVVDTNTCKRQYRTVRNTVIDNRVLCAGYPQGGKDACQGDSGGPLMFPEKNFYYLIGVVSGGYKCAEPGFSGIYTRVTYFLDFILQNLE